MALTYTIDHTRRLVRVRGSGVITTSDVQESSRRLRADSEFNGDYDCLTDFTEVTGSTVDQAAATTTASTRLYNPGSRRAIVAPSTLMYGLSRAYATQADPDGDHVRVFRELTEAEAWLEL
jgi:hypothetical protein